jgi:hypothetical protein
MYSYTKTEGQSPEEAFWDKAMLQSSAILLRVGKYPPTSMAQMAASVADAMLVERRLRTEQPVTETHSQKTSDV